MKIRGKFLIPVLSTLLLTFFVIALVTFRSMGSMVNKLVDERMDDVVATVVGQLDVTEQVVAITLDSLDEKNLALARSLAAIIAEDESLLQTSEMTRLAKVLGVDEVHVTDQNGVLRWGNIPDFYGFDFASSEQTRPFLPILSDRSIEIAQDPTLRGTDNTMFQYVSVARMDKPGIVQVGISIETINGLRESMSIQNMVDGLKIGKTGGALLLDANGIVLAASDRKHLGSDMSMLLPSLDKGGDLSFTLDKTKVSARTQTVDGTHIVAYIASHELSGYLTGTIMTIAIFASIGALLLCLLLVVLFRRFINRPLERVMLASEQVAVGDMKFSLPSEGKDEISQLGRSFMNMVESTNHEIQLLEALAAGDLTIDVKMRDKNDTMSHALQSMVDNLNSMFAEINEAAIQVSSGASQIATGSQALASGATQQAAAVEELSESINSVSERAQENAELADSAAQLARSIRENAQAGAGQMERMITAVNDIKEASSSIHKVMKVIDDIAFQTNILALNAAVEAARAGQYGKGFAVVAEEVRNLAAKSAEAAKDSSALINNSIERAELGAEIAAETADYIEKIVIGVNESERSITLIAESSKASGAAIAQINQGISQVAQVVHQNSSTAEESAAASEEMNGQTELLRNLVARFRLRQR